MKWPRTNPGEMRHQVTILRQTVAQGTSGPKAAFTNFVTTYAKIAPERPTDFVTDGQTISQITIPITIPWQPGIESNMRVRAPGGEYIIQDIINPMELNIELQLFCVAFKNNQ